MTRISDMTPLPIASPTGVFAPVEKAGSATNYRVDLAATMSVTPQMFGALADGVNSDNAAITSALAYLAASPLTAHGYGSGTVPLYIPHSTAVYSMGTTPIDLNYTTRISGDGVGDAGGWATALKWGAGSHGIRVQYYNTTGDTGTGGGLPGGSASIIEGLALQGGYVATEGEYHGFFLRGRAAIRDVNIWDFQGDGVHIHAASLSAESGNANNWELTKAFIQNTRNGVYITGSDANQGLLSQVSISAARQWGIYDEAGNSYLSPLTQLCGFSGGDGTAGKPVSVVEKSGRLFAVKAGQEVAASTATPPSSAIDDANWYYFDTGSPTAGQPTWFSGISLRAGGSYRIVNGGLIVGGYAEGGQPPAQLSGTTLVVGGQWPTLPKGGGYINANSNQIQINDLNVIAGGVQFADDHGGALLVGRYTAGNPGYILVSSVATSLTLRAPDNSDGVVISNANVSIPKALAVTGAATASNLSGTNTGDETSGTVVSKIAGQAIAPLSTAIGSGTVITKIVAYTPSLTPASVAAATVAEQTFTVTGLTTADKVIVNPPAIANATGIAGARVSAADTLAIRFVNPTAGALTPSSGTYTVMAFRS